MTTADIMEHFNPEIIAGILDDFTPDEIAERLNHIFNGYLGCDTGDAPDELQINHDLILRVIALFAGKN